MENKANTGPTDAEAEQASRELVKRFIDEAARRNDCDALEYILGGENGLADELLVVAMRAVADRAAGEDLDDLVSLAKSFTEQYAEMDAREAAKNALERMGMCRHDADRVVELCIDKVREQRAAGELERAAPGTAVVQ